MDTHYICDRCGTVCEIAKGYKMLDIIDRPNDEDLMAGNALDQHHVLCTSCGVDIDVWMHPGVESLEELIELYEDISELRGDL